jgi:inner membrane protein
MKPSIIFKVIAIGFLIFILLVPLFLIGLIVDERSRRREGAISGVSSTWGGAQLLWGPIITVPYRSYWKEKDGTMRCQTRNAHFLPSELKIEGKMNPEKRRRGIFDVAVYTGDFKVSGKFLPPNPTDELSIPDADIIWEDAVISMGITDTRGIKNDVVLEWDNRKLSFRPGPGRADFLATGIHAPIADLKGNTEPHSFSFGFSLKGTDSVRFVPAGMETAVKLDSSWPDPSFDGAFLPEIRNITAGGFNAGWKVSYFGRSYPQQWTSDSGTPDSLQGNEQQMRSSAFGVRLFVPADFYVQVNRSVKYAVLFVCLTFLAFFLFEVLASLRVHALHYLLIGLSLALFYLLLLSLSEHMGFAWAYLVSSVATAGMITLYCGSILSGWGRAGVIASVLTTLYGYLYVLLQLEDYALLLGSVALFLILSAVMYLTRKIDWYEVGSPKVPPLPPKAYPA